MNITLNGQPTSLASHLRVDQLIRELGLEGKRLAVEINRDIIPRSSFAQHEIKDGDRIEIVQAIGGG